LSTIETLFTRAKLADGSIKDIGVTNGRIVSIEEAKAPAAASEVIDLEGALVVPGFVEGHIHLDTSFYGDAWISHKPCTDGFDGGVAGWGDLLS